MSDLNTKIDTFIEKLIGTPRRYESLMGDRPNPIKYKNWVITADYGSSLVDDYLSMYRDFDVINDDAQYAFVLDMIKKLGQPNYPSKNNWAIIPISPDWFFNKRGGPEAEWKTDSYDIVLRREGQSSIRVIVIPYGELGKLKDSDLFIDEVANPFFKEYSDGQSLTMYHAPFDDESIE